MIRKQSVDISCAAVVDGWYIGENNPGHQQALVISLHRGGEEVAMFLDQPQFNLFLTMVMEQARNMGWLQGGAA